MNRSSGLSSRAVRGVPRTEAHSTVPSQERRPLGGGGGTVGFGGIRERSETGGPRASRSSLAISRPPGVKSPTHTSRLSNAAKSPGGKGKGVPIAPPLPPPYEGKAPPMVSAHHSGQLLGQAAAASATRRVEATLVSSSRSPQPSMKDVEDAAQEALATAPSAAAGGAHSLRGQPSAVQLMAARLVSGQQPGGIASVPDATTTAPPSVSGEGASNAPRAPNRSSSGTTDTEGSEWSVASAAVEARRLPERDAHEEASTPGGREVPPHLVDAPPGAETEQDAAAAGGAAPQPVKTASVSSFFSRITFQSGGKSSTNI